MSTNANMQREMCLEGPGGVREEEEEQSRSREWGTAETLVTASQSSPSAKVMILTILMMMSQPGLFIEITTKGGGPTQF